MRAMRSVAVGSIVLAALAASGPARAQLREPLDADRRPSGELPPSSTPPPPPDPVLAAGEPPPARTGFQVALRTGVSFPAGKTAEGQAMTDVFAWQVPLHVEIGAKVIPELFIGAYGAVGFGGVSSSFEKQCNGVGVDCSANSTRFGIEAVLHLFPARLLDPWIGYGLGYETTTQVGQTGRAVTSQSLSGIELAHLMAGLDIRLGRAAGLGPFFDVGLGQYSSYHRDRTADGGAIDRDVEQGAVHAWLSGGVRAVFLP